jgi:hypothetical protein
VTIATFPSSAPAAMARHSFPDRASPWRAAAAAAIQIEVNSMSHVDMHAPRLLPFPNLK